MIKKAFISRWKDNGYIVEADYSQLEIICSAFLSNDHQLRADILSGADLHNINAEKLFGKDFTDAQRKITKAFSFQLQYGAGAASMAADLNVKKALAQQFIDNYYARYPGVKAWQDEIAAEVRRTRRPSQKRTEKGLPAGVGYYTSITGRRYVFQEYDAPDFMVRRGQLTSFSPTQMKNYPVQGFATGDIVPLIVGKLFRVLAAKNFMDDKALLINTVHDSIILDIHGSVLDETARVVKRTMEDAPRYIKDTWGIDFDLPLRVELEYGRNWMEMEKYVDES